MPSYSHKFSPIRIQRLEAFLKCFIIVSWQTMQGFQSSQSDSFVLFVVRKRHHVSREQRMCNRLFLLLKGGWLAIGESLAPPGLGNLNFVFPCKENETELREKCFCLLLTNVRWVYSPPFFVPCPSLSPHHNAINCVCLSTAIIPNLSIMFKLKSLQLSTKSGNVVEYLCWYCLFY